MLPTCTNTVRLFTRFSDVVGSFETIYPPKSMYSAISIINGCEVNSSILIYVNDSINIKIKDVTIKTFISDFLTSSLKLENKEQEVSDGVNIVVVYL